MIDLEWTFPPKNVCVQHYHYSHLQARHVLVPHRFHVTCCTFANTMYVYINTILARNNSDLCTATINYDDYLFVLFIHRFAMENITASGLGRFYVSVPPEST